MVTIDLSGKVVLVTGGLGAIAEFLNKGLAQAGARLIVTDILADDEAMARIKTWGLSGADLRYAQMDVMHQGQVNKTIGPLFEEFHSIDIVVGNAGGCAMHPFTKTSEEEYERIFNFNYLGQTRVARAVIQQWIDHRISGHMIFLSSLVASIPWPDLSAYCPAKSALETFSKCMALEYADHGLRFNCIAPGNVAAGSSLKVYETDKVYREMVNRTIPLSRLVRPESIADALLWLCSTFADDVNGQVLKIDCGASIPKVG
jgi:NAD(P)-dependent dehydrogenase (short-subunit alcohol dehydrogenase family)